MAARDDRDTIAAIATATGAAGLGIVRLSGPDSVTIAQALTGIALRPRHAHYVLFHEDDGSTLDDGIALYFAAPKSYTGEDVVELQAHGSPVLLSRLLQRCLALGARAARPGEFTERAFLDGRLDLAQAEAVADLIHAGSLAAARAARRSLDGDFSRAVLTVAEQLAQLRVHVEAAFDFPDEDIDVLGTPALAARLADVRSALAGLRAAAGRGRRLVDGLHVVIAGAPNVGKSSLLNALMAEDRAIVSATAGTTRDLLRESLLLDGFAMTLVDTAGLHASHDPLEVEGIRRARAELERADLVLAVLDGSTGAAALSDDRSTLAADLPPGTAVLWLLNKSDLGDPGSALVEADAVADAESDAEADALAISARTGAGLEALRERLRRAGGADPEGAGSFSARTRHLEALDRTAALLSDAAQRLAAGQGELAAEELRLAQAALGGVTGAEDADALLGRIFAGFCIGK